MPLEGEYEPSARNWVREQVERYEATGGREASTLRDTGLPIAIFWNRGVSSGKVRKTPLMRVEHEGVYAMVGSQGGAPTDPAWVVDGEPAGLGIRESDGLITDNLSYFVPHTIDYVPPRASGRRPT